VGEVQALARQHRLAVIATRHSGAPASSGGFDRWPGPASCTPISPFLRFI
jgi:hypothetical protein